MIDTFLNILWTLGSSKVIYFAFGSEYLNRSGTPALYLGYHFLLCLLFTTHAFPFF